MIQSQNVRREGASNGTRGRVRSPKRYVKEHDGHFTRSATVNVASMGHFIRGAAKVIVSDYRYFLAAKEHKRPQRIRGNCRFLTAGGHE